MSGSMSTKIGVAPSKRKALTLAANVNDGTRTSSPRADAERLDDQVQSRRAGADRDTVLHPRDLGAARSKRSA